VVFAPKYRRKVFYGEKRAEIGQILRELCNWKKVNIINAEVCPDHIHMLIEIPPKYSVSSFMGFLKGKSSVMIYERWGNMKYKYKSREFWCRGYYVDTVGKNTKAIDAYISNQLKEDRLNGQLTFEDIDHSRSKTGFTGSGNKLLARGSRTNALSRVAGK
jgi:putative transposase